MHLCRGFWQTLYSCSLQKSLINEAITILTHTLHIAAQIITPILSTGPPHTLEFSEDMSSERLAEWLSNLVGDDYQQDIGKLMGMSLSY